MTSAHYIAMKYCSVCNSNHYPGSPLCEADLSYELTVGGSGWTCDNCGKYVTSGIHACSTYISPDPFVYPFVNGEPLYKPQGWQCPACRMVYAPSVTECDCEKDANYKKNK